MSVTKAQRWKIKWDGKKVNKFVIYLWIKICSEDWDWDQKTGGGGLEGKHKERRVRRKSICTLERLRSLRNFCPENRDGVDSDIDQEENIK